MELTQETGCGTVITSPQVNLCQPLSKIRGELQSRHHRGHRHRLSPEEVWRELTDFAGYAQWHPALRFVDIPTEILPGT